MNAPKKPARLPKALTPDETAALFIAKGDNTVLTLRDTAMFELLYSSALRVSEMVALDVADLDSSHRLFMCDKARVGKDEWRRLVGRRARRLKNGWRRAPLPDVPMMRYLSVKTIAVSEFARCNCGLADWQKKRLGRSRQPAMCFAILVLHISYNPAEICAQRKNCSAIKYRRHPNLYAIGFSKSC